MITPALLAQSGSEHSHQSAVFCWAAYQVAAFPCLRWMYAIPNGGGRTRAQGGILKAEGVKPGVSDICLPFPKGLYHGLYIEMKRADGVPSDVSPAQHEFQKFVAEAGYCAVVCYGWEQAVEAIQQYLRGARYAAA